MGVFSIKQKRKGFYFKKKTPTKKLNKCYLNPLSPFHELNTEHRSISKSQHTTEGLWDHLCGRPVSDVALSTNPSEAVHGKEKQQLHPLRKQLVLLGTKSPCFSCSLKALGFYRKQTFGFSRGGKHHLFSCTNAIVLWGSRNQLAGIGLLMEGLAFLCPRASRTCLCIANMSHGWVTWKLQGPQLPCQIMVWHFFRDWFKEGWGVVWEL